MDHFSNTIKVTDIYLSLKQKETLIRLNTRFGIQFIGDFLERGRRLQDSGYPVLITDNQYYISRRLLLRYRKKQMYQKLSLGIDHFFSSLRQVVVCTSNNRQDDEICHYVPVDCVTKAKKEITKKQKTH